MLDRGGPCSGLGLVLAQRGDGPQPRGFGLLLRVPKLDAVARGCPGGEPEHQGRVSWRSVGATAASVWVYPATPAGLAPAVRAAAYPNLADPPVSKSLPRFLFMLSNMVLRVSHRGVRGNTFHRELPPGSSHAAAAGAGTDAISLLLNLFRSLPGQGGQADDAIPGLTLLGPRRSLPATSAILGRASGAGGNPSADVGANGVDASGAGGKLAHLHLFYFMCVVLYRALIPA